MVLTMLWKFLRICLMTPGKVGRRSSCTVEGHEAYLPSVSRLLIHYKANKHIVCCSYAINMYNARLRDYVWNLQRRQDCGYPRRNRSLTAECSVWVCRGWRRSRWGGYGGPPWPGLRSSEHQTHCTGWHTITSQTSLLVRQIIFISIRVLDSLLTWRYPAHPGQYGVR